jgi:anti-sigma regulatory factor (Ser/Thr protein kinase)
VAYSPAAAGARSRHVGFFYRTEAEYVATVTDFLRAALAAGEAAFAAVSPARASLIRDALGPDARDVEFVDMTTLGRNPGRIIPHVLASIGRHAGHHVRYVGEMVWAAHGAAGIREGIRHEALMNLAFAEADVEILCPYDTAELDPAVIADARRTHPLLLASGRSQASPEYVVPSPLLTSGGLPLPEPGGQPSYQHTYSTDLSPVRALVLRHARAAGLSESRASDLVLAVSEVAANTLRHTHSPGTLTLWRDENEVVCEIRDSGTITDPLAGRHRPGPDALGGHGLWLVHQVCDLVELNSDESGTTIRMHMTVNSAPAVG